MSFQAYLDNIEEKTGKTPNEFIAMAKAKGFDDPMTKAGEIVDWLKADYGLGRGHAMAIVLTLQDASQPKLSKDEHVAQHFGGDKARWRKPFDELLARVSEFGPGVSAAPTHSYISLLRNGKKFAIVQVTTDRLDIGIKLKGANAAGRFETAGDWNSMVTHRVKISAPQQIDAEVLSWLKQAYEKEQNGV